MQTPSASTGQTGHMPADSGEGQRTSPTPANQASGVADSMPADSAQGQRTSPAPATGASEVSGDSSLGTPVKGDSALKGQASDTTASQPRQ
jgi:hypothetical protein